MIKYKRDILSVTYHLLHIFECPKEVILFAAGLASKNVTIENYTHYRNSASVDFCIREGNLNIKPKVLKYDIDFRISQREFIALISIWNSQGCYAVFHDKEIIKFKVTDLENLNRYSALNNFDWTLELAIPGSASSGWGQITSPKKSLIDEIENYIKNFH